MSLTRADLSLARIVAQRLVGPQPSTAAEVVGHLGCVQAQDLPGALLSVALRTPVGSVTEVRAALDAGQIVRSWPMRGTLHFAAARDIGWMCSLTSARMLQQMRARRAELGLDEPTIVRARDLVVATITERGPRSRAEVLQVWEDAGLAPAGGRGYHLLVLLCFTGVLVQGPMRGQEQLFALLDRWVPNPRDLDRDAALGEWARQYFTSHGPATVADFCRWTGLRVADARRALEVASADQPGLQRWEIDGVSHWGASELPDLLAEQRRAASGLFLLPGFDELILGYKDRSVTLDPEHEVLVVPGRNGVFRPTVVQGGVVRGTWKFTRDGVETSAFGGARFPAETRIQRAAAAVQARRA